MPNPTLFSISNSLSCKRLLRRLVLIGLALAGFAVLPANLAGKPTPTPSPTPTATPDGDMGNGNTAEGNGALFNNIGGANNTADGFQALFSNVNGNANTGTGYQALFGNIDGVQNTATGNAALASNTSGGFNAANGFQALTVNTLGNFNTADGYQAMPANATGSQNVGVGSFSLNANTTGNLNIGIGYLGGGGLTTGSNNIDIGNFGVAGESGTIRIGDSNQTATFVAGISGTPVAGAPVVVDANGQLGVLVSSARFKSDIKPISKSSEAIFGLNPVTFRYTNQIDPNQSPQFGLVAEEVEKVDPDLVACDARGEVYTVRYEAVNAMMLNEFLKEHRRVQELEGTIAQLKSEVDKQEAAIAAQQKKFQKMEEQDRPPR